MYNYVNLHKHNLLTKHAIETNAARLTVHGLPPAWPTLPLSLSLSSSLSLSIAHTANSWPHFLGLCTILLQLFFIAFHMHWGAAWRVFVVTPNPPCHCFFFFSFSPFWTIELRSFCMHAFGNSVAVSLTLQRCKKEKRREGEGGWVRVG